MKLVLFDVDGTLLDNRGVDDLCYERAFRREFGVPRVDSDWSRFAHCTDSYITREILRVHLRRDATDDEVRRAREAYVAELHTAFAARESVHAPMTGAAAAIRALKRDGWKLALASGGWRVSALLKLKHSRLPVTRLPGAFADDHVSREGITRIARERAEFRAGREAERVVYVGDAVWDVKACRALGLPFVGIGRADRGIRLRAAGASFVLADFANRRAFRDALDRATPPG
jgi:phosphoglycolate phosphatase-like HAD superfamily hydrolase